jgi:hypothetical protein
MQNLPFMQAHRSISKLILQADLDVGTSLLIKPRSFIGLNTSTHYLGVA